MEIANLKNDKLWPVNPTICTKGILFIGLRENWQTLYFYFYGLFFC